MMLLYPNVGALHVAGLVKTNLVASKLKLFKSAIALVPGLTKAALDAVEADFDGYAAITIAAWLTQYIDPAGGGSIQSGTQQFTYVDAAAVGNTIYGFWVETAGGVLVVAGSFDAPITMTVNGDAIPLSLVLNYGRTG